MSESEVRVFSEDVASFYESNGLLSPVNSNKRKISSLTISPPASRHSSTESSPPEGSLFQAASLAEEVPQIEVPANLQSVETYMFLGFSKAKSEDLWRRYCSQPIGMDAEFIDFANWAIEEPSVQDASSSFDDWDHCMQELGIDDALQHAILLSEFDDIRFTATCKFWLLDAVQTRFDTLLHLDERLRQDAVWVHRDKKKIERRHSRAPTLVSPSSRKPLIQNPHTILDLTAAPVPITSTSLMDQPPSSIPLIDDTTQPNASIATILGPPSALNLHTMIWHAGARIKCQAFYNEETKAIHLPAVYCIPGDFNGIKRAAYWTPQKETADRYAQWAKHKYQITEIAIIQVAVPEILLGSLNTGYLWFSSAWKNVVWHSRNGLELSDDVAEFEEKDLLIGHIASGKHRKYEGMKDFKAIKESDVLTVSILGEEKKSVQWVFQTRKARTGFEEHCKGKVWIHELGSYIIPPKAPVD